MIYTFYSYKGGVGRSMALANIAELFFRNGKKVLMVDWDLEAPGLDYFFFEDESHENLLAKPGLVDMLIDYKEKMMQHPKDMGKKGKKTLPFKALDHFLVDIYPDINNGGKLWLLSAGKRSEEYLSEYTNTILTFDWKDFYDNWAGELYFEWLRRQFENKADVILIDSRTGLTEMGGVCTYQMADTIILLCGTNHQNIEGTYRMAKNFTSKEVKKLRSDRPLNIMVIPVRIENTESTKLDEFKVHFFEKFNQFRDIKNINEIWQLRVPYIPKYSYWEMVAVREGSLASAEDMSDTYQKLYEILENESKRRSRKAKKIISKVEKKEPDKKIKHVVAENEDEHKAKLASAAISKQITLLHMSEIHFMRKRKEESEEYRKIIQNKLVDAVRTHSEKHAPPNFVVVTGDIAFSGQRQEYEEALLFFKKLESVLPEGTQFLVIPGNHDVDRSQIHKLFSLHRIVINGQVDEFLGNKRYIEDFINEKFKAFRNFCTRINPSLYDSKEDYFWVKSFMDKDVSFLGLNSSWACEGDKDRFNIALGYPQVKEALYRSKDAALRIALMHHPQANWLKDLEVGTTRTELFKHCQLLLHSHDHTDRAEVFADPANSIICLGTNASYTDDKDGFIGFQFVQVNFQEGKVACRVWPYIFDEKRLNDFVPDRERYATQGGKAHFDIHSFELVSGEEQKTREPLKIPEDYKNWLAEFHSNMAIDQLARKGEAIIISMPEVYIHLETKNNINIEELLGRVECLLLRGAAGMGKTTLVKHLAYTIARGSGPGPLNDHLPVIVFLKDLWPLYENEIKSPGNEVSFESLLEAYLKRTHCPLTLRIIKNYISQNRALFLLDGLDDIPERLRASLMEMIASFRFAHQKNRFLLTGRPHGITGKALDRFGKYLQDIEPLDQSRVETFIIKWFRAVSGQARGLADLTAGDMIADIRAHEHISVFTQNPLLLTAVCILYQVGKRLPEQRADLYRRIVDNLLFRRFQDSRDPEKVNRVGQFLMRLAFTMQKNNIRSVDEGEAREILKQISPPKESEKAADYNRHIHALFEEIEPNCGLLSRLSSGEVEFSHLTFQEFLAARYLIDMEIDCRQFLDDAWWEETVLLYTGLMNLERMKRSNELVMEIMNPWQGDIGSQHGLWLLGARALRDFQSSRRADSAVNLARQRLLSLIGSTVDRQIRFKAGNILGYLGDLRLEEDNMVLIEGGEFIRGSKKGEGRDSERPQRKIYLDPFLIGKYPVTNQEYKAFVDDGGYQRREFWTPEGWHWPEKENISEPLYWHNRKWNGPNFPVVGISWYEAVAFCKWLSQKTGEYYRLPTETEWEKAARGTDGREYPWGNKFDEKKCNSLELGLGLTSPVGIFPEGKSPYECLDMAGNVWEWCFDWIDDEYYEKSPEKNPQGPSTGVDRVLRGGSWLALPDLCRCAYRLGLPPAYRDDSAGVRLARSL